MENKRNATNNVFIEGEICSEFKFIHEMSEKYFYLFDVKVKRNSGIIDTIKCMINSELIDVSKNMIGTYVKIKGRFRSFNRHKHNETENKVLLTVIVKELEISDEEVNRNDITLTGFVCKLPVYRKTPLGRDITDLLIAVHRPNGKSDYIPCICWESTARYVASLNLGDTIKVIGRIQSREYVKNKDSDNPITKTAYEVSVGKYEIMNGYNEQY